MMDGYYIKRVGQNRGAPRVWFEGTQTERAGFKPGQRYDIVVNGQMVVLQANPDGSRVVSAKKAGERSLPVIDLNSRELLAVFDGMAAVRVVVKKGEIYLMPLASEIRKRERFARLRDKLERGEPLTIGSVSHGGGVLSHALHAGLGRAGVGSRLSSSLLPSRRVWTKRMSVEMRRARGAVHPIIRSLKMTGRPSDLTLSTR